MRKKMPIQRDLYSPDMDYHFFTKLNNENHSNSPNQQQQQQQQIQKLNLFNHNHNNNKNNAYINTNTNTQYTHNQASSDIENINEIRKLIREQTLLKTNVKLRTLNSNSDSSDELEVPIRRFTPLPDIPRSDEPYFRTESRLIKAEIKNDSTNLTNITFTKQNTSLGSDSTTTTTTNVNFTTKSTYFDNKFNSQSLNEFSKYNRNKETRYHFATTLQNTNQTKKVINNRLPALEKIITHTIQNTMDLDEDLPMNPEPIQNQRGIYTSPGDRIISPIKRPQAPSPLSSSLANRRKANQKSDSDSDSDQTIN